MQRRRTDGIEFAGHIFKFLISVIINHSQKEEDEKMKINAAIIAVVTILALAFWTAPVAGGDTEPADMVEKYEALIDDTIAKCLGKGRHLDSRSSNLRRAAIISCLKAGYLRAHKEELTVYLVGTKAIPSSGVVQYYLNKKFFEMFRPLEIYALLSADQIPNSWRASKHSAEDRDENTASRRHSTD
jgi:hypothetical protein